MRILLQFLAVACSCATVQGDAATFQQILLQNANKLLDNYKVTSQNDLRTFIQSENMDPITTPITGSESGKIDLWMTKCDWNANYQIKNLRGLSSVSIGKMQLSSIEVQPDNPKALRAYLDLKLTMTRPVTADVSVQGTGCSISGSANGALSVSGLVVTARAEAIIELKDIAQMQVCIQSLKLVEGPAGFAVNFNDVKLDVDLGIMSAIAQPVVNSIVNGQRDSFINAFSGMRSVVEDELPSIVKNFECVPDDGSATGGTIDTGDDKYLKATYSPTSSGAFTSVANRLAESQKEALNNMIVNLVRENNYDPYPVDLSGTESFDAPEGIGKITASYALKEVSGLSSVVIRNLMASETKKPLGFSGIQTKLYATIDMSRPLVATVEANLRIGESTGLPDLPLKGTITIKNPLITGHLNTTIMLDQTVQPMATCIPDMNVVDSGLHLSQVQFEIEGAGPFSSLMNNLMQEMIEAQIGTLENSFEVKVKEMLELAIRGYVESERQRDACQTKPPTPAPPTQPPSDTNKPTAPTAPTAPTSPTPAEEVSNAEVSAVAKSASFTLATSSFAIAVATLLM